MRSIVEERQGRIYIATTLGLATVNSELEMKALNIPQIDDEYIRTLKLGPDGIIYGVTQDGDVFTLQDGALTGFYTSEDLGVGSARAVLPDQEKAGWVYLAGAGAELYYGELSAGFRDVEPLEGGSPPSAIPPSCATTARRSSASARRTVCPPTASGRSLSGRTARSSQDLFWIVTSNSLAYMSGDGEITTIRKFPYSNNFDLYENSRGEMWVLSSNGIYVAPVEELLANGEIDPTYYGRDDGLPCIAAANSYSELTADGDLYISGTTGVTKVNIETSSQEAAVINMTVPYMEADGVRVYPDENGVISIASDVNRLTIYGHVFTYSLGNPEVTYYLEGLDQEPTTVLRSDLTPVSYTNLKGGSTEEVDNLLKAGASGSAG